MSENNKVEEQIKKCPKCGEDIQFSAKVCKHCQSDVRNFFLRHKIFTVFLILVMIGMFSSVISSFNETQDTMNNGKKFVEDNEKQLDKYQAIIDNSPNKNSEKEKLVPQITTTSANISLDYSENEVAADAKYKGKVVEVSGKIYSIDNGISDNEIIIILSDGKYDISGTHCYMQESEREKALTLKKGQQVTLIGVGDSATLSSPILKKCVVK